MQALMSIHFAVVILLFTKKQQRFFLTPLRRLSLFIQRKKGREIAFPHSGCSYDMPKDLRAKELELLTTGGGRLKHLSDSD
mmetsp:Transcript_8456/g.14196  ORF Transcript_8456/g.14196 Transcript_8456/m.14196 type:complete len:81 (+) Transcript_8456:272-514(+)